MRKAFRSMVLALAAAVMLTAAPVLAQQAAKISEQEAAAIGTEAYIYGYPLVTMELTRQVLTNVAEVTGDKAPMGQFAKLRAYPTPANKEVTAPNADTLYTHAWLNLAKEPWVLSIPDMKGRYYLTPMLSGWTDVFQGAAGGEVGALIQNPKLEVRNSKQIRISNGRKFETVWW